MKPKDIERLRHRLGHDTKEAFCAFLGISQPTYWRWLHGHPIGRENLWKLTMLQDGELGRVGDTLRTHSRHKSS